MEKVVVGRLDKALGFSRFRTGFFQLFWPSFLFPPGFSTFLVGMQGAILRIAVVVSLIDTIDNALTAAVIPEP